MERRERTQVNMEASDSTETKQSKQRASIKWLLSKAFNNRVPDNLVEPFYRDHEDQEHLKPPILGGLANAELYCLALANMYSDPNYHSLNHWNILQTLVRKGVQVHEPPDCGLTETVLIQTNPLKMSAHMCVMEALMSLYAREVVTLDRVSAAAQRFGSTQPLQAATHEDGLLAWINAAVAAINKAEEDQNKHVPPVQSFQDLCDGTALAALISFYCPEALPNSSVRVGRMSSIQDCLHNLMLVYQFCTNYLPHNVFHMLPEDVTYMRGSMRQNLVALLADLFNMLEVHPVKCVKYPGSVSWSTGGSSRRSVSSTPERRSASPMRDQFVVHRGRAVPTLASVARRDDDTVPMEPSTAAGRPSKWGASREGSFAGRRSRRSSITEDSQLTVENFGGSQDTLHFIGRNPEKEMATLDMTTMQTARKISAPAGPADYNPPIRTSRQDSRGSIQLYHGDFNGTSQHTRTPHTHTPTDDRTYKLHRQNSQPPDNDRPYYPIRRQLSSDTITIGQNLGYTNKGGGDSFYLNRDVMDGDGSKYAEYRNGEQALEGFSEEAPLSRRKSGSFSAPQNNTTTWQKQYQQQETHANGNDDQLSDESNSGGQMVTQLNNIRLKLEEKRRRIEGEKRRMEIAVTRQRQQLGQQAFLQAVTRKGGRTPGDEVTEPEDARTQPNKDMMMEPQNPNVENSALLEYQQSIAKMNSNLQEIQSDIARLANQQSQLQQQQQAHLQHQQQTQLQQQQAQLQQQLMQLQQQQTQQQNNIYQPQQPYQQVYQQNIPQMHQQFGSSQNVSLSARGMFGSSPHMASPAPLIASPAPLMSSPAPLMSSPAPLMSSPSPAPSFPPEPAYRDVERQFYLHEDIPPRPARRTWAQHAAARDERNDEQYQQQNNHQYEPQRSWRSPSPQPERAWTPQGFTLHARTPTALTRLIQNHDRDRDRHNGTDNHLSYTLNQYPSSPPRNKPDRLFRPEPVSLQQLHNTPSPPVDMEPQNISFIGTKDEDINQGINRLNISSGTRTYRIPSPTRPTLNRNSFQQIEQEDEKNEKGFYISFDEQPKRPKPPLRKRNSPKKGTPTEFQSPERRSPVNWNDRVPQKSVEEEFPVHRNIEPLRNENQREKVRERPPRASAEPAALVIADKVDPNSAEEMERKKERIMLLSLQRRQRAEEARARAEQAAAAKREREEQAKEERNRRREEQSRRREVILSQYKMKKAIEEAEREGKVLDKCEVESLRAMGGSTARLRPKGPPRTRPKTIHVDSTHVHPPLMQKQTSSTNLTAGGTMRRDYYRGSQDSLAERAGLYRGNTFAGSPVEGGAAHLGRRGSCKTSREELDQPNRGRSKYTSYGSSIKAGRKSSSLMNLCDSGLGRWTPPRRAPSPLSRGPPSLGAGVGAGGRRRPSHHDDNSDASSHHSSILDYSGPRLYKQPTTKSNRGIMLNAVEYCVFPGAVNAEAKRRVLEEIARSESKHFLVLFRDAGCQFRALYSFCPDSESVTKLYGTGPKHVNDRMFDKFFKYNSGSKCFSQVHTKHLTVTIDAFTIHNSLWQGKKVQLPSKKDMALVI